MEDPGSENSLRRPLLEAHESTTTRTTTAVEEWNASVAAFIAESGGEDHSNCYCSSIDEVASSSHDEETGHDEFFDSYEVAEDDEATAAEEASASPAESGSDPLWSTRLAALGQTTLIPDVEPTLGSYSVRENDGQPPAKEPRKIVEGVGVLRFLKFVLLTLGSIYLVRKGVIAVGIDDRDQALTFAEIWVYEGDAILRDLAVFFVVGRMHQRPGVDTLEWLGWGLVANLYFESQAYIPFLQHAVTPYEMHCVWPWQLWAFAVLVVVAAIGVVLAHARLAHQRGRLWVQWLELLACVAVLVLPVIGSPYAHLHHWFAGWLLGMHAHCHDRWWSRATMAYCWGMYVNGIAVYGRDPLLTCDYARFVAEDQHCPVRFDVESPDASWVASGERPGLLEAVVSYVVYGSNGSEGLDPPDWRNCSDSGYHP